ncbi:exported protein of unknown function [Candidatus Promineifilum breve]|uniref:Uncharacterized protein n=1 Tax=Candidatus Promineifilum breve TaxID=1806508 RepID=A0A160T5C2_9CHLR|nr:exported protein of unknown function [Candidatus Promineifilum breve]
MLISHFVLLVGAVLSRVGGVAVVAPERAPDKWIPVSYTDNSTNCFNAACFCVMINDCRVATG